MKMSLCYLTLEEALEGLEEREFSSVELVKACLDRIEKYDKKLNAFITINQKQALSEAETADAERKARRKGNRSNKNIQAKQISGIPIAVKDMFVTEGIRTTAGSKVLENYKNPQYDAAVVKKLKKAGAIIIGKLNQDAWAHGASGENSDYKLTKNPWDTTRVPGGSSSGSGAAVAAGFAPIATGTDTGGSIRNPAAFCGITGLKPTYGRVSRYGVVAMASSLDCIGHMGRSVWDIAKILEIIAGKDNNDATTADADIQNYTSEIQNSKLSLRRQTDEIRNLKIGLPKEYFGKGLDAEVKLTVEKASELFSENGAKIEEISLPHTQYGVAAYYIIMASETSSNLARYDGVRYGNPRDAFGDEAKRRIMLGTYSLSSGYYEAYYRKAMQVRTLIKRDFANVFAKVDLLLAPVVSTLPFKIGEKQSPLEMYLADTLTIPSSLAGNPALSLPCGFSREGLPIGMQLIGPHFRESLLLQIGHAYQQMTDWHERSPKL